MGHLHTRHTRKIKSRRMVGGSVGGGTFWDWAGVGRLTDKTGPVETNRVGSLNAGHPEGRQRGHYPGPDADRERGWSSRDLGSAHGPRDVAR